MTDMRGQGTCPVGALGQAAHLWPTPSIGANALAFPQMVHKTVLDVAEEGTEAAAATGTKIVFLSGRIGPRLIVSFDRPFLLSIHHDDTQDILFWAKVTNPNQA